MRPTRVLIAEDHRLVRAGFQALLAKFPEVEVIAEAVDRQQAIDFSVQYQPDIVMMDISMPRLNGIEATRRLINRIPSIRIIILSMYTTEEYVLQALRAGATGYLLKDSSPEEFLNAIQAAIQGETYICSGVIDHVVAYIQRTGTPPGLKNNFGAPHERLTPRQLEIFQLVVEGNSSTQIAAVLDISAKTVERHRADMMERLNIHDLPGLVRYAIRVGIISLED